MKRIILATALAAGVAGTASAQDPANVVNSLTQSVVDLRATSISLLGADAGATTANLANTVNNLSTGLSAGTPLAPLSAMGVDLSNTLVDASTSFTPTLTELGAPLAEAGAPFVQAYADGTQQAVNLLPVTNGLLSGAVSDPQGFQPVLESILNSPSTELLTSQLISELSADNLDVDSLAALLDPSTLTGLADGGPFALPIPVNSGAGLEGLGLSLGNLPGLPGADGLPALPGADALPLDALDPAVLTDLLNGGLPQLPGADGLPGLPSLPGV